MTVSVKLLKHSVGNGIPMLTYECEIPRIILAELNTHKMLCRNTQSSRAVPIKKYIEEIENNPYVPSHWGKAQPGMQAVEETDESIYGWWKREDAWRAARRDAIGWAEGFEKAGYHKQIVNRLIENFSYVRIIISGTEWNNFFSLRIHKDAEPNIRELAVKMYLEKEKSMPFLLNPGEWHLPYIETKRNGVGEIRYYHDGVEIPLDIAMEISVCSVAQVSYRKQDITNESVARIYNKLLPVDGPQHLSPFEHQATPMQKPLQRNLSSLELGGGVSHLDKDGYYWSGQLRGWIQKRKIIPNENEYIFSKETFNKRLTEFKHGYI